jgi:subtilisin family serine protease
MNDMGCVGVAPKCNIITVKVLSKNGTGTQASVNAGLEYALIAKPDVVSMSLGSPSYDETEDKLIKELYKLNIPVVAAAGNEGGKRSKTNTVNYPGKLDEVITVGAVKEDGSIADFSSWGQELDIACPGYNIYSTYLNRGYANLSGTSMATPFCAGIIALMLAKHRKQELETGLNDCKTVDQIKQHLYKYADITGVIGYEHNSFGWGRIDPIKSVIENSIIFKPIKEPKLSIWSKIKRFFSKLFN